MSRNEPLRCIVCNRNFSTCRCYYWFSRQHPGASSYGPSTSERIAYGFAIGLLVVTIAILGSSIVLALV